MNTLQEIKDLINKYKDTSNYDPLVNDLCRLYFEIEEQNKKESPFDGSQLKEPKDDAITEQSLLDLGFSERTSRCYEQNNKNVKICYHTYSRKILIQDLETNISIFLPKMFDKTSELESFINSIT